MFWLIVATIFVLILLFKKGVFRKKAFCQNCGKPLSGPDQKIFHGDPKLILCKACADKIHPQLMSYAQGHWSYSDYNNYLIWEETTREERAQFNPDLSYGYGCELKIDVPRGLFSLGTGKKEGLVYRFEDVDNFEMDFKPEEIKEGVLGDKVKGVEFITVDLNLPTAYLERTLNYGVKYRLRKKGILSSKYLYELSDEFEDAIRAFSFCFYFKDENQENSEQGPDANISQVEKALALFMFDSIDQVTAESLKKQRNALIKTFHPDNAEQNESYSQKINGAYDLLSKMLKDKEN